ncbi:MULTISPECIES: Lrp/AsnC ligand binding domain-containing protein [Aquirufa]|jgi:Lrp/AsnC family transcriptional regulator for asnA, asnC and gidA|uniref:Winged helix-turn-helix transcriptional regulator n=6 Tax=Aquirufa TaxID=2676247 RepID=A0ABT4JEG0_9BACT|nr:MULTISPECIES: Lrp/AsnC ligand binding domain-containing protein [Aquirufa]AWL09232.1 putative HTH-type transcriptional regulator [Aquirufa nivalisilvae]MBZ1325419.1 winged helix-turn-helix transcriptional regulator [Aquirufa aurantiipilula]MCZ2472157.1 winged helix-turn-helix transcriptional regulator [Aquirufa ecclesiirivi]MCZ2474165.1 winged helix-turn-helix transcriptional regulator [Aquirufa ecclesiirivi]MCZ2480271.1 winged helix-turn-helix transcriptional regulator [Aquirufa nivalisilv
MDKKFDLDPLDYKILEILVSDSNLPYTEIGQRLDVSGGTVHVRMKKMEALGIVKGAQLLIDYSKIGWDITAFLGIYLDKSSLYEDVAKQLEKIPEVVNIHYTTGIYSIFAKIICRDTQHLREVLHDKIQRVTGIQRTETFISLEESLIRNTPLF